MLHTDIYYFKLFILLLFHPVSSPRRFRAKVLSPTQLQVSWKEPKGEFEGYNVIYTTLPGKTSRHVSVSSPTFTQRRTCRQKLQAECFEAGSLCVCQDFPGNRYPVFSSQRWAGPSCVSVEDEQDNICDRRVTSMNDAPLKKSLRL